MKKIWTKLFSRLHATLYVTMSVGPSVGPKSLLVFGRLELKGEQISVTAPAQLPYCPCPPARDWCCRVYGLVKKKKPGLSSQCATTVDYGSTAGKFFSSKPKMTFWGKRIRNKEARIHALHRKRLSIMRNVNEDGKETCSFKQRCVWSKGLRLKNRERLVWFIRFVRFPS